MAFNVSSLPNYKDQQGNLVAEAIASSRTIRLITTQPGNKGIASLNNFGTAITFQDGKLCGFNASGDDTLSQRDLVTAKIKINKSFCLEDLEGKYTQERLSKGANYDDTQFAEDLADAINEAIGAEVEKAIWQSEKQVSPASNLEYIDGFLQLLSDEGDVIDATGSTAVGSIIATVNAVYAAIPAAVVDKEDIAVFMGTDTFRTWTIALTNSNLYHYAVTPDAARNFELVIPGTNVTVYGVSGLNGTGAIVAGRKSNLVFGTDLVDDLESYDIWYSKDNGDIRFEAKFRIGAQVRFPDQVVYKA
jgi:hypothetical protein